MNTASVARTTLMAVRLTLAGAVSLQALEMPDLSGNWRLNKDMSDDPKETLKDAPVSDGTSGGGSTGGDTGMHRGGRGGHGMGRGGGSRSGSDGGWDPDLFARLGTIRIRHQEPLLAITDASGRERALYTDGRKVEEERSHGGTTKVTARWKDAHIEVTSVPERGPKVTETYSITADRSQLTVTTKIEGGRRADMTVRRVYDAVTDGAPPPSSSPSPKPTPSQGAAEDEPMPPVSACAP